ncbi:hypothetical protein [Pseudoalteromonas obscura]|uniref:Orphan protein n=1 Tax=Pseudoalteromonas obscura TaxID=3048491 RepID=A0ABT7EFF3_9GAMM|nr:hypothetical protein [Pseudoalteromonas sp. P94(2023)]MDK2594001.1 hypothetical protein [Pseudoalteromonas sp. P94(2023)]
MAQSRAERLQQVLDEYSEQQKQSKIKLNNGQKVEWTSCDHICFLKVARDYVEIMMPDNRSILHNEGLAVMEEKLLSLFYEYIAYLLLINALFNHWRSYHQGSNLILTTGEAVPVSTRMMPKVKNQLDYTTFVCTINQGVFLKRHSEYCR